MHGVMSYQDMKHQLDAYTKVIDYCRMPFPLLSLSKKLLPQNYGLLRQKEEIAPATIFPTVVLYVFFILTINSVCFKFLNILLQCLFGINIISVSTAKHEPQKFNDNNQS